MMGLIVVTVFFILLFFAEHSLAFAIYESMETKWSKEYVRRFRIMLRLFAVMALLIIWALTLSKDLNLVADQIFWLLAIITGGLGCWTMLGARKKK